MELLKNNLKFLLYLFIIFFNALLLESQSLYYYEPFNNWTSYTGNGWNPNYRYGRDGVFYPPSYGGAGNNLPSTNDVTGGRLRIYGTANNSVLAYNNYWVGRVTKFIPKRCPAINRSISATAERPFGFQIVRYGAIIDTDKANRVLTGYHQGTVNVWLIQDQPSKTNEWDTLDNFVYFFEKGFDNLSINSPDSVFGYYAGSEIINTNYLKSVVGPNGSTYNFYQPGVWRRCYDDDYNSTTPPATWAANDTEANSYYSPATIEYENTNTLGIKIIHNGSSVQFYLNPNPIDGDGIRDIDPNQYFYLGSANVGWNTNLAVMIGHENLYFYFESTDAIYDNFLIRSAASNVVAEIYPTKVRKNSSINFSLEIKGNFSSTNDAGIGEIRIKKPEGYGAWNYANIFVYTNNVVLSKNAGSDTNPTSGFVSLITQSGGYLKIRFRKTSASDNGIINFNNNKVIRVEFSLQTPSSADASGKRFEVYINNEKYSDTGGDITLGGSIKYSTCGWQKAIEGNAGSVVNTSSLLVKVYNDPQAFAGITVSPVPVYEDNSGTVPYTYQYEFSTTGISDCPEISKIIINYPDGVNISSSNVSSLLLQNDSANITVSNATHKIIINYLNDPAGFLPSPNGYDRITIKGYGTPDLPLNTLYTDYIWSSIVSSEGIVVGSSNRYTTTNSTYPSQKVRLIIVSPEIECAVDLTNGVGVPKVANSQKTNRFIYSIYNTGTTKVLKAKLVLPSVFTNAFNFISDLIGTNINFVKASNILYLDYSAHSTNIPSGKNNNVDNIRMTLVHNRSISAKLTNVNIIGYADNGNTEGYVIGSPTATPGWTITITPPDPSGQSGIKTNVIFTTLSTAYDTNILYYTIWNNGAVGNNLAKAKIYIPSKFEILNVSSSHIANDSLNISTNNHIISLNYYNDPNGVLKSYIEVPSEKDIVTITLRHKISTPTNFVINCQVSNESATNWAETTIYPGETKTLSVQYPPVNSKAYIIVDSDPVNNIIDSSTTTNSLTYVITNCGKIGNRILRARILVPTSISTNIINILSSKIADDGSYVVYDKNNGIIYLNYIMDINGALLGGQKDIITFKMIDYVTGEGIYIINSKVSNDREMKNTDLYPGKSLSITFDIPDADAAAGLGYNYIYTNAYPKLDSFYIKVTNRGRGSNYLKKVKILFPSLFNGKVYQIHSSYLSNSSPTPYLIVSNSYAEIKYDLAGKELVSSGIDLITINFTNNFVNTNTVNWDVLVDNGDGKGYVPTYTILGMSKQMKIIVPADVNITPEEIYTTATNIQFTYTIHNGVSGKSINIRNAKIFIPYPFHQNNIISYNNTWSGSSISKISNYIFINYTSANLTAGAQDVVTIVFSKVSNQVTTYALFNCKVDYGEPGGYRDTITLSGNTNSVFVIFPPADAYAYATPNEVAKDINSSPYNIYIKNIAGTGNYIYQAKITPPNFITNITSITSDYISGNCKYSNGKIIIKYFQFGTNISSLNIDRIKFIAFDNVNSVTQGDWIVEVNNTTNTNGFTTAAVYPGKSLTLSLYQPSYNSSYFVTPNNIYTTDITNQITISVKNISGDSSKINKLKISIPNIFVTNNLKISNKFKSAYNITPSEIIIDYSASNTAILPNQSDEIKLWIKDTINEGYTNCKWKTFANYDSSGFVFISNIVMSGKSASNYFVMPTPVYNYNYNFSEIYTTTTNFTAKIIITNKGVGTHKIKNIKITIPTSFTNGFDISDVNSTYASSKQKNNNIVRLIYTNFKPSYIDTITLSILNTNKNISSFNFIMIVSNGYKCLTNQLPVNICIPGSASLTPNEVLSTSFSNNFTLILKNDGTANLPIKNAIIYLPNFITNVKYISTSGIAKFTNSKLLIDYSSSPIQKGNYDTINFSAFDSIELTSTNVIFNVCLSNDFGLSGVQKSSTNNLKVKYNVPPVYAYGFINIPKYIYTTITTNIIVLKITNYGMDLNNIKKAVIELPSGMQVAGQVGSSHLATNTNIKIGNNTTITLYYLKDSNGNVKYGQIDLISIPTTHSYSIKTNVEFIIKADNGSGLVQIYPDINNTLILRVKYPEEPSKFYIIKPSELYTIDTNVSIKFKVINASYDNKIERLYITFWTNIFKVRSIASLFTATNNFYFEQDYLVINYTNFSPRNEDELTLNVSYYCTNTNTFKFISKAVFSGSTNKVSLTNYGNPNTLKMLIADFGRIVGSVLPTGVNVTVELLKMNNENATNKLGEFGQATVVPATGGYLIDWVLPGEYNLRFVSKDFRITYYKGVTVYSNKYTILTAVRLKNLVINNEEPNERIIKADDNISYIKFPPYPSEEDFYLDVYKKQINSEQISAINKNSEIVAPNNPSAISVFDFDLENLNEEEVNEVKLKKSATIVLYYTDAEISSQGFNEDSLAIYYYKPNTKEWVKIGGVVDKENNCITIKVDYLNTTYAIFGSKPSEFVKNVSIAKTRKIITPGRGGNEYENLVITFEFKNRVNEFYFTIYDLKGRKIYKKKYDSGPYHQAEIYWDGKDQDGYYVKSGIYIYQIEYENEYYKGMFIVAK